MLVYDNKNSAFFPHYLNKKHYKINMKTPAIKTNDIFQRIDLKIAKR